MTARVIAQVAYVLLSCFLKDSGVYDNQSGEFVNYIPD